MSRLKNFSRNLATSYLQLGVNVVYSLVSIPLILHWLPREEFGMWAMLTQLMSYVSLIDLGMTSAVARLLVDFKDQRGEGGYGSLVKTAFLVSFVQGLIILMVVMAGSPLLASLMKIPVEYQSTFIALLRIQGLFAAFSFSLRPLGLMLYAHQRMDIQAYSDMSTLISQLGLLLLFLMKGCGIYSFVYANAVTLLLGPSYLFWNCRRLGLLPSSGEWGKASREHFKSVFGYGRDVFLMGLGSQLIMTSQTMIVSRSLGLESAAIWSIGTKMFNLVSPLMCRPFGAALPGMYEMIARGENQRLKNRFQNLVLITASLGAFLGISFAMCNTIFIQVWTGGKITWLPENDVWLACWLFILSMQTTHCNFVSVTKHIGGMRYVFFLEGCAFILITTVLSVRWGVPGIVGTSILCSAAFSYSYGLCRSARYFSLPLSSIGFQWVNPSFGLAVIFGSLSLLVYKATGALALLPRLCLHVVYSMTLGTVLFFRFGFPREMLLEVAERSPQPIARFLRQFCVGPTQEIN